MSTLKRVKLVDEARDRRLKELTDADGPTCLEGEIGVARLLQEEFLNSGQPRLALEAARTIGQLAQTSENANIRRGELLCKTAVLQIAQQFVQIVAERVEGEFDGWEDALDDVQSRLITVVCEAQNPEKVK